MSEKKSLIEIVLMPLVVALVGILGTVLITKQQQINTKALSDAQLTSTEERSKADRQIRVLEMFVEKITSDNERDRILALKIVDELDSDLAARLASAVSVTDTDAEVSKYATTIAKDAAVRAKKARVFIHIAAEKQRPLALNIARRLGSEGYVVPGIELVSDPPNSSQLRYFRSEDKDQADQIEAAIKMLDLKIPSILIKGYENVALPGDYEVWLSNNDGAE